jgi:O-antigen ligase
MVSGDFLTQIIIYVKYTYILLNRIAALAIRDTGKGAIDMEKAAAKRWTDLALTNTNIITYTAVSIFLPYALTAIVLTFLSVYIIINKNTRQLVFIHSGAGMMKLFFLYVLAVPLMYRNWLGLAVGAAVILGLILGLFLRSIMTRELYERVLTLICAMSLTSAGYAMLEALAGYLSDSRHSHRIAAVFSHPNYFGTAAGTVVIICAYKILTHHENKWFYYGAAAMNVISMYLCKSMFVWVEVFIGITVLLALLNRRRLLALWISAAAAGAFLIFFLDFDLIPRLNDIEVTVGLRQQIWSRAIEQIRRSPLFGHGFLSFHYLFHLSYRKQMIPHAHNIWLDMLLNFGITGTVLFLWYFLKYYIAVFKSGIKEGNGMIAALILAVTAAAIVHGATDLTLLWIQTLPLFFIILSGQGSEEKTERMAEGIELF